MFKFTLIPQDVTMYDNKFFYHVDHPSQLYKLLWDQDKQTYLLWNASKNVSYNVHVNYSYEEIVSYIRPDKNGEIAWVIVEQQ